MTGEKMGETDPANATVVYSQGGVWGSNGSSEAFDSAAVTDYWGGITIAWNETLQANVIVASCEIRRFGLLADKQRQPDGVQSLRSYNSLKGFRVYVMDGPLPDQWRLIATRTTDIANPDALIGQQQGSGSLDAPNYHGGQYMILSAAPDDIYGLTEHPDYLHSPGYQVWDMSDPAAPRIAATLPRPPAPPEATFTDFCQRGGSLGPKRSGTANQPGYGRDGVVPYAFYTPILGDPLLGPSDTIWPPRD